MDGDRPQHRSGKREKKPGHAEDRGQDVGWVKRSAIHRNAIAVGFATLDPPDVRSTLLPTRLLAGCMVDIKYLYGFVRDLVKNFIWIPNERNHADAGALCHLFRTHWPHADTALYTLEVALEAPRICSDNWRR